MKTIYEYIIESKGTGTSDDDILFRLGKYMLSWMPLDRAESIINRFNITKNNPKAGILRYMKDSVVPIMPNKDEVIHRDRWDLDGLLGETEYQLLNPDYYTINKYIISHSKRKHDILTIFQCSSKKPYVENSTIKNNYLNVYKDYTDFAWISNPGIIPAEYCGYYPYRYDEWNIIEEQKIKDIVELTHKYRIVNMCRFIRYVKSMGYKHVIVAIGNPKKQWIFDEMIKHDIEGASKWLHIATNDNLREKLENKYKKLFSSSGGMAFSRTMQFKETRDAYTRILKGLLNETDKSSLQKIVKDREERLEKRRTNESLINEEYTVKKSLSYSDIKEKFKKHIKKNMDDSSVDKGDNYLFYKSYYWTVLDIVLIALDGDLVEDIDGLYWDTLKNLKKDSEFKFMDKFLVAYKPLLKNDKVSVKEITDEAFDLKIIREYTDTFDIPESLRKKFK